MRVNSQTYQMVRLDGVTDRLREHPRNPKQGAMGSIHESVNVNGFYGAVVAQLSTGYILAGNHRYRTAQQQRAEEIPVIWLDVDDATALRILLADNRTADLGGYNESLLEEILADLDNLEGTGYGLASVQEQEEVEPETGGGDFHLHPENVPDDEFESQFGVVVLCEDADHQRLVYEMLGHLAAGDDALGFPAPDTESPAADILGRIQLRVVAI